MDKVSEGSRGRGWFDIRESEGKNERERERKRRTNRDGDMAPLLLLVTV